MKKNKIIILSITILSLLTSFMLIQIFTAFENTLLTNNNWNTLEKPGPYTHIPFDLIRSLIGNKLHLTIYDTASRIIYKEKIKPKEIKFEFKLSNKESYFFFVFNNDNQKYSAIRIGNSYDFRNSHITAKKNGKYITKTPMKVPFMDPKKWHNFTMVFRNNNFDVYINDKLILRMEEDILPEQYFGFMGSCNSALIDNITVIGHNEKALLEESFSKIKLLPEFYIIIYMFVLLIHIIAFVIFSSMKMRKKIIVFNIMLCNAVFSIIIIILLISFPILARNESYAVSIDKGRLSFNDLIKIKSFIEFSETKHIEKEHPGKYSYKLSDEEKFNILNPPANTYQDTHAPERIEETMSLHYPKPKNGENRILFIGGSQTWGLGANFEKNTFVYILNKKINSAKIFSQKYKCINAGIMVSDSSNLLKYYKKHFIKLEPDIVYLNLSNNDYENGINAEKFESNLIEFIDINKANNIQTVLMLEPNCKDCFPKMHYLHKTMLKVASENKIEALNLHDFLLEKYDEGIIWQDYVHLTPFGNELVADYLYDNFVNKTIKKIE